MSSSILVISDSLLAIGGEKDIYLIKGDKILDPSTQNITLSGHVDVVWCLQQGRSNSDLLVSSGDDNLIILWSIKQQ